MRTQWIYFAFHQVPSHRPLYPYLWTLRKKKILLYKLFFFQRFFFFSLMPSARLYEFQFLLIFYSGTKGKKVWGNAVAPRLHTIPIKLLFWKKGPYVAHLKYLFWCPLIWWTFLYNFFFYILNCFCFFKVLIKGSCSQKSSFFFIFFFV